jgi:DNA-binding XRE family transcriptional regulator
MGETVRALRLAAAAAGVRERLGPAPSRHARDRQVKIRIAAEHLLDPLTRATAWAEGQAMTLEQAIAVAFETARVCEERLAIRSQSDGAGPSPDEARDERRAGSATAGGASLVHRRPGAMGPPLDPALAPRAARAAFGALLRRYRLAASLSQELLAERAGLSVQGLSALENGRRQAPYRHTVTILAEALGLSAAETATLEAAVSRSRRPALTASDAP